MTLTYIIWNVNPEIFGLPVRWYGLLFALGFFFAYMALTYVYKQEKVPLKRLDTLTVYVFIATVLGARIGHCFFYEYDYYMAHPVEIFKIWEGGLASHGAGFGILIALIIYFKKFKVNIWWLFDRVSMVIPISAAFVRFGNLMNSEIYGKPTNVPWAFEFVRDDKIPRHPTQLYEAFSYLLISAVLFYIYKRNNGKVKQGMFVGIFLTGLFGARFIIEFFKDVQVDFEKYMTLDMGQWLSIPFILMGVVFLIRSYKINKAKTEV
jgi:prolipoprotein diacylglyceryl transferase